MLGIEKLNHLIEFAIEEGRWEPLQLSRVGLDLSHLFFANDLLLFGRAKVKGAICLRQVLDQFCSFFGHKVSARKTQVFFSANVDD